jgi:hypothetical protein
MLCTSGIKMGPLRNSLDPRVYVRNTIMGPCQLVVFLPLDNRRDIPFHPKRHAFYYYCWQSYTPPHLAPQLRQSSAARCPRPCPTHRHPTSNGPQLANPAPAFASSSTHSKTRYFTQGHSAPAPGTPQPHTRQSHPPQPHTQQPGSDSSTCRRFGGRTQRREHLCWYLG